MFDVTQENLRQYFASIWRKKEVAQMEASEKRVLAIILEHPEYQVILENIERYIGKQWIAGQGETNPFLHMSLHLSLQEQCAINQPEGVVEIYHALLKKYDDRHMVEHLMMDALSEMIWQAQNNHVGFDVNLYFTLLRKKLGLSEEEHIRLNPHEV